MTKVPGYESSQRMIDPNNLGNSSVLQSNSKYLNDPRLRDWVATESLRRNGQDYNHYGGILELLEIIEYLMPNNEVNRLFAQVRSRNSHIDAWFEERYLFPHDLDGLRELPPGTLGREYANMLDEQNLTPDFLPDLDIDSDFDYYKRRSQQTHDIEHIVTGFLYDPIGEWGLIATKGANLMTYLGVELTRHLNVFSQLLLSTGLSRVSLHYPQMIPPVFRAIGSGEKLGREMKPIFTPRYEEMFDWPVEDVRSALDIVLPLGREDTMWSLNTYFERG